MAETQSNSEDKRQPDSEAKARREFLKKVSAGAVTVPAVMLLLAASAKAGGYEII
jgi:hypothetical protein